MIRWVLEARDAHGDLIEQDDQVWLPVEAGAGHAETQARHRWPEVYRVQAYRWVDDREILSPGE